MDTLSRWDRLALSVGAAPFARPGWVEAWAEATGRDSSVAVVERDGRLVAVLPVVVDGQSVTTAADWHVPFTEAIALDSEAMVTLMRGLDHTFRRVTLDFVVEGSLTELIGGIVLETRPKRRITRMRSPYVDSTRAWDEYRDSMSTKKLRELRRRRRRLEEAHGPVRRRVVDGAGEWAAALEAGFAVEASGWKGRAGTAVASDPATVRMYRGMAAWAAREKLLEIGLLVAGERIAAFDLALSDGSRTWLCKTGFDAELSRYAPGQLLRHDAIAAAFDRGLESYEFAGSAEPWKEEWTSAVRPIVMLDAYRRGLVGRGAVLGARFARFVRVAGSRLLHRAS